MASAYDNIDIAAEVKRRKQLNPNENVNSLLDAGLAKAQTAYGGKYLSNWQDLDKQYRTNTVQQPVQQMQTPQFNIEDRINQLSQARQQSTLSGLQKSKDTALSNLSAEESTIKPQYYNARNSAAAQSQQGARSFAEYIAARGGINSGVNDAAQIARTSALQGQIGNLRAQETAAISDIARRRSGVQNAYESDVQAANAGIQAQALEQTIAELQRRRDLAVQQDQFNQNFGLQQAGLTGVYNNSPTLAAQNQAFNQGLSSQQLALQQQNQAFNQQLNTAQFNEGIRQFDAQIDQRTREFETQNNLDIRKQTFAEQQALIDNAVQQGYLGIQQGNLLLNKARFAADNDPDSLDNQYKQAQIARMQAETSQLNQQPTTDYDNYREQGLNKLEPKYDSATGNFVTPNTKEEVKSWVFGLPLSDDEAYKLARELGVLN